MIFDAISKFDRYTALHPYFILVSQFMRTHDPVLLPPGRIELSNGAYVNIDDYVPRSNQIFEAHRKFIDVQCMIRGDEFIFIRHSSEADGSQGYDISRDLEFFEPEKISHSSILLKEGFFAVFFPEDLHAPVNPCNSQINRKLVFKIPVFSGED